MRKFIATLFLVPALALANGDHKPKPMPPPPPPPVPTPAPAPAPAPSESHSAGPFVLGLVAAGLVGVIVYQSERKDKKVTLAPTPDAKGATASIELRF